MYLTDPTDSQWELIAPLLLTKCCGPGGPEKVDYVDASIMWSFPVSGSESPVSTGLCGPGKGF